VLQPRYPTSPSNDRNAWEAALSPEVVARLAAIRAAADELAKIKYAGAGDDDK
jgi:hypothetical protein